MKKSIHALILEDSRIWAEMLVTHLEKGDYQIDYDLVQSEKEFREKMERNHYDIVLSDYNLPQWTAERAYQLIKESDKNIPFIVVTGSVGEEKAVELLKMGINDLVFKENLLRLPLSIRTALENKEIRDNQKNFLEKLEHSELKFRGVLEQSEIAIFGYDCDGTILFWNAKCGDYFNISLEHILGKKITVLVSPEEENKVIERTKKIFNSEVVSPEDGFITDSTGRKRNFHAMHYGVKDASGKVVLGVSAILDITERMFLEEQLMQARKMEAVGQLTGGIAHDFNNQLTVILCGLKLALKEMGEKHSAYPLLVDMNKAAEHCAFTVRELLTFGHKSPVVEKVTLDFHAILEEYEKFIRHLLPANIHVEVKKNAEKRFVEGDATQIQQVMMNLTVNARDAMPSGGQLFIETKNTYFDEDYAKKIPQALPGQFICIAVTDTGSGIPAHMLPKIFDPFFTTKRAGEGTGLGLSSVYGIVKDLGGWINVYSEINRGTTFKIYLPVSLGSVQSDPNEHYVKVHGGKETILIADDEESIRNLAKTILERKGYHTILAKDGEEATDFCKKLSWIIDLVLLDLTMPKFSTDESIQQIISVHPNARIVISSGYSLTGETAQNLLSKGAVAFVQKPYQPEELAGIVRNVLDLRIRPETIEKEAA